MTNYTILPRIHLGTGDAGRARKAALLALARKARHFYNGEPSIGRWLCALADEAGTKPEPSNLEPGALEIVTGARERGYDLSEISDAIDIVRLRITSRLLRANGFTVTDGDCVGWAWMDYIIVHDPANDDAVYADLAECRVLLDTVREMKDPAAAYARWRPKVRDVEK